MDIITLLLLSASLAMDAFAVCVSSGMVIWHIRATPILKMAGSFGLFQGIMPLIGYIIGGVDLSTLNITLSPAVLDEAGEVAKEAVVIGIGTFLTTVIDFILVAFVVFLVVKAFNAAKQKLEKPAEPEPEEPEPSKEELLLTEIRDLLKTKG